MLDLFFHLGEMAAELMDGVTMIGAPVVFKEIVRLWQYYIMSFGIGVAYPDDQATAATFLLGKYTSFKAGRFYEVYLPTTWAGLTFIPKTIYYYFFPGPGHYAYPGISVCTTIYYSREFDYCIFNSVVRNNLILTYDFDNWIGESLVYRGDNAFIFYFVLSSEWDNLVCFNRHFYAGQISAIAQAHYQRFEEEKQNSFLQGRTVVGGFSHSSHYISLDSEIAKLRLRALYEIQPIKEFVLADRDMPSILKSRHRHVRGNSYTGRHLMRGRAVKFYNGTTFHYSTLYRTKIRLPRLRFFYYLVMSYAYVYDLRPAAYNFVNISSHSRYFGSEYMLSAKDSFSVVNSSGSLNALKTNNQFLPTFVIQLYAFSINFFFNIFTNYDYGWLLKTTGLSYFVSRQFFELWCYAFFDESITDVIFLFGLVQTLVFIFSLAFLVYCLIGVVNFCWFCYYNFGYHKNYKQFIFFFIAFKQTGVLLKNGWSLGGIIFDYFWHYQINYRETSEEGTNFLDFMGEELKLMTKIDKVEEMLEDAEYHHLNLLMFRIFAVCQQMFSFFLVQVVLQLGFVIRFVLLFLYFVSYFFYLSGR